MSPAVLRLIAEHLPRLVHREPGPGRIGQDVQDGPAVCAAGSGQLGRPQRQRHGLDDIPLVDPQRIERLARDGFRAYYLADPQGDHLQLPLAGKGQAGDE